MHQHHAMVCSIQPPSRGSPGIHSAKPAYTSGAGPCPVLGQCLVALELNEESGCAPQGGRTGMSPGRQGITSCPAVLSQPELASLCRHGCKKKNPPASRGKSPHGPWRIKAERGRGERDKQFPTQLWLKPILQETHGP